MHGDDCALAEDISGRWRAIRLVAPEPEWGLYSA